MQEAIAKTKYVRISPRKARFAADLIRGMNVEEAQIQLSYSNLRGGRLLKKTLVRLQMQKHYIVYSATT